MLYTVARYSSARLALAPSRSVRAGQLGAAGSGSGAAVASASASATIALSSHRAQSERCSLRRGTDLLGNGSADVYSEPSRSQVKGQLLSRPSLAVSSSLRPAQLALSSSYDLCSTAQDAAAPLGMTALHPRLARRRTSAAWLPTLSASPLTFGATRGFSSDVMTQPASPETGEGLVPQDDDGARDFKVFLFLMLVTDAKLRRLAATQRRKIAASAKRASAKKAREPRVRERRIRPPRPPRRKREASSSTEKKPLTPEEMEEQRREAELQESYVRFIMLFTDRRLSRETIVAAAREAAGLPSKPTSSESARIEQQDDLTRVRNTEFGSSKWVTYGDALLAERTAAETEVRLAAEAEARVIEARRQRLEKEEAQAQAAHAAVEEHKRAAAYYQRVKAIQRLKRAKQAGAYGAALESLEADCRIAAGQLDALLEKSSYPSRVAKFLASDDGSILWAHREYRRAVARRQRLLAENEKVDAQRLAELVSAMREARELVCLRYTDAELAEEKEELEQNESRAEFFRRYAKRPVDMTKVSPRRPARVDDDSIAAAHNARQAARYRVRKGRREELGPRKMAALLKDVKRWNDVYKKRFNDPKRLEERIRRTQKVLRWQNKRKLEQSFFNVDVRLDR